MTQVVTSDQFVTGVLCGLVLKGVKEIKLVNTMADARFEKAYGYLVEHLDQYDVEPDFSLLTNRYHGDSETLRETLYAVREQGVVAINNPSFKTVEIKLAPGDAQDFLESSVLGAGFYKMMIEMFFNDEGSRGVVAAGSK